MNKEVIELEAEEIPLEEQIEKSLIKNNVTDAVISELGKRYSGMALKSLDDKEGYLEIKDARKEVRKIGILVEKCCKAGREDAIKIQKLWLGKEKQYLDKIDAVQAPLDAEIKKYEDEVARKEKEEQERKEREYMARQTTLLKMEAKYENDSFTLGNVSYEINNIKEADQEIWEETILPKYKREFEKIEAVRAEEELKRAEEAEKLRLQQEELERKQKEFEEKEKQFQLQQAELQRKQDEANRIEREQKEKEAAIIREKQDAQNKTRMQEVMGLGLMYVGQHKSFVYEDINVSETDIITMDGLQWKILIDTITPAIHERKEATAKREEEIKQRQIEDAKQEAIRKEQERIQEENRLAEVKRQQEEQQRKEELAKASDKEKWAVFVKQLGALELPVFTSNIYKGKLAQAKEKIEEIQSL